MGPSGVEREYKCQPGSIRAVTLAKTLEPEGAEVGSIAKDHCTGSRRWARQEQARKTRRNASRRSFTLVGVSGGNGAGGPALQLRCDSVVDAAAGKLRGHANGVLDRVGVGTAVTNGADSTNP